MIDRRLFVGGALAIAGCATLPFPRRGAWAEADAILGRIRAPSFPRHEIRITEHGARIGEEASRAVADAIRACAAAGGGRVTIPAGLWPMNGPIHLASNIELHVEAGAHVRFGKPGEIQLPVVLTRWEGTEVHNFSPLIYARDVENVAITGPGTFDGQGREGFFTWRPQQRPDQTRLRQMGADGVPVDQRRFGPGHFLRPAFVQFFDCRNVLLDGPTFLDSPFWMIHPVYCRNVIVRNLLLVSRHLNSDGIDPDSCEDVLIERCRFDVSDDCVAIKSGRDQDGWRVGRPCRNVILRDCDMTTNVAAALAIGSEMSGGASDIYAHDLRVPHAEHAIYFKANLDRGGVVERVRIRDVAVGRTKTLIHFTTDYHSYRGGNYPPTYRDFTVELVICRSAEQALHIVGVPAAPVENVTLRQVEVISASRDSEIRNARGLRLEQIRINGQAL